MSARAKNDQLKPLSKEARKRAIAKQTRWVIVDRFTGEVIDTRQSRSAAREMVRCSDGLYVIELVNLRVQGMRA